MRQLTVSGDIPETDLPEGILFVAGLEFMQNI